MLVLDSTIGCIEATESEVLDLYRSAPMVKRFGPSANPESLEAYVCSIKKKTQVRVYLAFVAEDRRIYVFTKPGKGESEGEHQQTVRQALEIARTMGFSPEQVDLSYSPAMREVVIRNTKILRPPGSKVGAFLKHGAAGAPELPMTKSPGAVLHDASPHSPIPPIAIPPAQTAAVAADLLPAAVKALQETAAMAELGRELQLMAAERDSFSSRVQQLSLQQQGAAAELAGARDELARLTAERDAISTQLQQLSARHDEKKAELSGARDKLARLTAERDALSTQLQQLSARHGESDAELCRTREEVVRLSAERDLISPRLLQLEELQQKAAGELTQAREECARLTAERDALLPLKTERKEAVAEKVALTEKLRGLEVQHEATCAELCRIREDLARATTERDALTRAAQETGSAASELVSLRDQAAEMSSRGKKAHRRTVEVEAENASLAEKLAEAEQQILKLSAERDTQRADRDAERADREAERAERLAERAERDAERAQRDAALKRADEVAAASGEAGAGDMALPDELSGAASLPSNLPPFLQPEPEPEPEPEQEQEQEQEQEPEPVRDAEAPIVAVSQPVEFPPLADLNDFFSATDDDAPTRFILEKGVTSVEYRSPEEVVELYQSINNAYLSPEGKGQESCRGYICCLGKGNSRRVLAAIFGLQSGRTSVYLPEAQPEDEAAYDRTLRGAVSFAEDVGFMMETVKLGTSAKQLTECLERCPVLRKAEQN